MGALSASRLRKAEIGSIVVLNRTPDRGARLAAALLEDGVAARSAGLDQLPTEIALADVVITCTGAVGAVLTTATLTEAMAGRVAGRPLVICDLGLPRDVDPAVAQLPGVTVIDLTSLNERLSQQAGGSGGAVPEARRIVTEEVAQYLSAQRSAEVTPTVTALRRRAAEVVDAELLRMSGRLPELDPQVRDELTRTVRRVVDKLLHTPTVRVKQLAEAPGGDTYAEALRELFGLDPQAPAAVAASSAATTEADRDGQRVAGMTLDQIPRDGVG